MTIPAYRNLNVDGALKINNTAWFGSRRFNLDTTYNQMRIHDANGKWCNADGIYVDGTALCYGNTNYRTTHKPSTASDADKPKYAGYMFFDTDLHKWVVWDGTQWTDMCGNALT